MCGRLKKNIYHYVVNEKPPQFNHIILRCNFVKDSIYICYQIMTLAPNILKEENISSKGQVNQINKS